jgi:adenylosuccinate lyase
MDKLMQSLKNLAFKHKKTICIGRSHGIHAEPTTFGIKMAQAYAEMKRNRGRLVDAQKEISYGAISGAVGTFSTIDPYVEKYVCEKMGLIPEPVSSQVIPRDRHAFYFSILAIIASSIERLSVEIRHLQRSEVLEAEEFFSQGQKGSSAMPHKRNPVLSENLTGLSRLVRMNVIPSLENICLWHERDISHSSVERNIGPDANILLDFSLNRLSGLISNLVVYPENMRANLNKLSGLVNSQRVLLALIQEGESREKAYEIVQRCAMIVWDTKEEFFEILANDKEVSLLLSRKQLEGCFDENFHLKNVDIIFDRVFV